MDAPIFDRLAALRAAAQARAERIQQRALVLEARRRDLHARRDALRPLTVSPAVEPDQDPPALEPAIPVPVTG